jgi:hypothetical protein
MTIELAGKISIIWLNISAYCYTQGDKKEACVTGAFLHGSSPPFIIPAAHPLPPSNLLLTLYTFCVSFYSLSILSS